MNSVPHTKVSMIEWVKSLNKKDIGYDEQGRLIIRAPSSEKNFLNRLHQARPLNKPLANKLLHPSDRVEHQSLIIWTRKLSEKFKRTITIDESPARAERLAEVYNNAALILFSLGDVQRSREICYSQIQLFLKKFPQFTFQPWVNLSRIDRALGNYEEALKKLQALDQVDYTVFSREYGAIAEALRTCSQLEPIKVYLQMRAFEKILDVFETKQKKSCNPFDSYLYEACAVALSLLDRFDESMALIQFAKGVVSPVVIPVFMLRECELNGDVIRLLKLYEHTLSQFKVNTPSSNAIIFSHHLAEVLTSNHQIDQAIRLCYESFAMSHQMGDEVLKAECLVRLYGLMADESDKCHIKKLMVELFGQTQYVSVRKKLTSCYPMLLRFKIKDNDAEALELYQKLTTYASACSS